MDQTEESKHESFKDLMCFIREQKLFHMWLNAPCKRKVHYWGRKLGKGRNFHITKNKGDLKHSPKIQVRDQAGMKGSCVCMCIYVHECECACMHVYIQEYACVHVCVCVYTCVCMHIFTWVCVHTHVCTCIDCLDV